MEIIKTNIPYSFPIFTENLKTLYKYYPFLKIYSIGNSVFHNSIFCIQIGTGPKKIFYSASYHANEWITSLILMKFIEDFCFAYQNHTNLNLRSINQLFDSSTLYFVPMVNPDGVNLVTNYYTPLQTEWLISQNIAHYYPQIPFPNRLEIKLTRS